MASNKHAPNLERAPEARAETVEDLVRHALRGRIRIPNFQRGLKWEADQVLKLFDSIYRGLPVGSLLLALRDAPAGSVNLGAVSVAAPETSGAWFVVDGQQRLTSLVSSLARPLPIPRTPTDVFVVYFDVKENLFKSPPRTGGVPDSWIPVPLLLDAVALGEWVLEWRYKSDRNLVKRVFEAGKRIREYRFPLYIVDTDNADVLHEIFFRINNTGKTLTWDEVHDALYGHTGRSPSTIAQLANNLEDLGMGRLEPSELTSCLLALRGLDPTRTLAQHRTRDPNALKGAVADALPVLRQVLAFLRSNAAIPHLRLLPRTFVIDVLSRFFARHPEPNQRTQELLTRWVWRAILGGRMFDERTLQRRGVAVIGDDEEDSVQALLGLVPKDPQQVAVTDAFDARSASSRVALLALASLGPRDLKTGQSLSLAPLIERLDVNAFRHIIPPRKSSPVLMRGPANRVIVGSAGNILQLLLKRISTHGAKDPVLQSHAITADAADHLVAEQLEKFLETRRRTIEGVLQSLGNRLAGWSRRDRDRPTLSHILRNTGAD